jgi:hypothetical protein
MGLPKALVWGRFAAVVAIAFFLITIQYFVKLYKQKSFVSIQNGVFHFKDDPFYPIVLNYKVTLYFDGAQLWSGPYSGYQSNIPEGFRNLNVSLDELRADFELIKKMGFNSLRIVGIGEHNVLQTDSAGAQLVIKCKLMDSSDFDFSLSSQDIVSCISRQYPLFWK